MSLCEIRAAFRHAIPGGYFSKPEVSDLDMTCAVPADVNVKVRGMERGNNRDGAAVLEVGLCRHHLGAFEEVDHRLRQQGWSSAVHGPPIVLAT